MYIHCLGLNHITAPVSLREQLVFSEETIRAWLARLGHEPGDQSLVEMVILSTCNRIEIYTASTRPDFGAMEAFLSDAHSVPLSEIRPYLYQFSGADTIHHLLNVAAGLDSLVLGEPQILGQVTRALELARSLGAAGALLSRLFQTAIHAGKRAQSETAINRNPASVSSLAASVAEKTVHNLKQAQAVIVGAGEMAERVVESLRKRGVEKILVINRTPERAQGLAKRWGAESATFDELDNALARADILIASTGAPHTLISAEMVAAAMQQRPGRPLVLIDIAVPRDIAPEVAELPHVRLFDIDNLNINLEQSLAERAREVPLVQSILAEEQREFSQFLETIDMLPLIADLRQQAESIRRAELGKTLRRLPGLTEAERARVEAMSMALVKKLLEAPTQRLRAEAARPHAPEYAMVTRALFGLDGDSGLGSLSGQECPVSNVLE